MSALRTAKKTFLQNLSSLVRTSRKFWSAYYSLRPNWLRIPAHLSNGPVTAESVQNKCDLLNYFFAFTVSHSLPVSPQTIAAQSLPGLESISCSSEDVRKLLTSMPSKTPSGPDGISSQMLKISASSVAPQLSALFNLSPSSGSVPTDWKLSKITPVYKAGDPSLVSNYHPISLLSLPSKILERIVHNKLLDYLLSNSLLSRSQFGFRPSSSTQEALISAITDWHKLLDSKENVAAVFFDLSKAFDSIPHSGILNALSSVGISGSLHQWFASYLSNRRQCVLLDGCSSTPADVSSGDPQGSILGPLLFILYMDSITLVQLSPDTKILLYADDILLYSPIYQSSGISIFQSDVDSISQWVSQSGLRLNAAKTKLVLFSRKHHPPPITLSIDGTPIPQVNSIKYLGVILSSDLSWARHIVCLYDCKTLCGLPV